MCYSIVQGNKKQNNENTHTTVVVARCIFGTGMVKLLEKPINGIAAHRIVIDLHGVVGFHEQFLQILPD